MSVKVKFDRPKDGLTKGIKDQMVQDAKYEAKIKKDKKKSPKKGSTKKGK